MLLRFERYCREGLASQKPAFFSSASFLKYFHTKGPDLSIATVITLFDGCNGMLMAVLKTNKQRSWQVLSVFKYCKMRNKLTVSAEHHFLTNVGHFVCLVIVSAVFIFLLNKKNV
uniref:Uncharacterized protein n=1 Tax=Micrurus paraensis TaxID=1970185 RepID=A0A2D4L979_9SAUR